MKRLRIAIEKEVLGIAAIVTLGTRALLSDYSEEELDLIHRADIIFYPALHFIDIFAAMRKEMFPTLSCYRLLGDRQKQTALLTLLDIPRPRTRVYYGHKQKSCISSDFSFPLVAKSPVVGSNRRNEVFLVQDHRDLAAYNSRYNPAYIQEFVEYQWKLAIKVFNYRVICGYREGVHFEGRQAVPVQRTSLSLAELPEFAIETAGAIARAARLSDVCVDFLCREKDFVVLGLDFGFSYKGCRDTDRKRIRMITRMIQRGEL
ncbi:MAG: hypothetical protein JRJ12_01355 [Deltaproteobacteria bacterium]|nr:hypothetical protein [Deltaproteobacteria bacterium]MBW2070185.1 hypothetical protein [Deltaproteobacteria bacterium]